MVCWLVCRLLFRDVSRSFSLFPRVSLFVGLSLGFSRPVWSGPCVIGAESAALRRNVDADTDAVPTEERSRACGRIGHGQRQRGDRAHRTRRYLAGSKIATAFVLYGARVLLFFRSFTFAVVVVFCVVDVVVVVVVVSFFLLVLSVRTALAGSRAPPGNLARLLHQFSLFRSTRSPRNRRRRRRRGSLSVDRFSALPSLTRSLAAASLGISGCDEPAALATRLGRVDTAPIASDNPEFCAATTRAFSFPSSDFPIPLFPP